MKIDYVEVSLFEIINHLPIRIIKWVDIDKIKEITLTHITLDHLDYSNEDIIVFHYQGETKQDTRLIALNTIGSLKERIIYTTFEDSKKLNININAMTIVEDSGKVIAEKKEHIQADSDQRVAVKLKYELIQYNEETK